MNVDVSKWILTSEPTRLTIRLCYKKDSFPSRLLCLTHLIHGLGWVWAGWVRTTHYLFSKIKKLIKLSFFSIFSIFILLIIWRVSPLYTGEPTCVNPIPGMGQARLYISCLTKKVSQHGSIHFCSNPWWANAGESSWLTFDTSTYDTDLAKTLKATTSIDLEVSIWLTRGG